jgi:hypothetical protein
MASFYADLVSARTTIPDMVAVLAAIKTATGDATAVLLSLDGKTWRGKKAVAWTAPELASAQNIIDTTAPVTPQLAAQRFVDAMSIYDKAQNLAIIDQLNVIRNLLTPPKTPDITPTQAIAAVRQKAGTL